MVRSTDPLDMTIAFDWGVKTSKQKQQSNLGPLGPLVVFCLVVIGWQEFRTKTYYMTIASRSESPCLIVIIIIPFCKSAIDFDGKRWSIGTS